MKNGNGGDKGQKGTSVQQKATVDGMAHYSALCLKSNGIRLMQITTTDTERRGLESKRRPENEYDKKTCTKN